MKNPTQLDLFADVPPAPLPIQPQRAPASAVAPRDLSDAALISALPDVSRGEAYAFAAEAGRRRLVDAVPALVDLCKRFAGYGAECVIPEQIAALQGLGAIGGAEAADAVTRLIVKRVVEGPNLAGALIAASAAGSKFDPEAALPLLRHEDPAVRAPACDCARASGEVAATLIALLADRDGDVAAAAACALGRKGRT